MKFLFRADGNEKIGAGHIMRCLSIAQKAKTQGIDCVFVISDDSYFSKIINSGIRCIVLGTDFRKLEDEIPELLEKIAEEVPDKIIVDSYYVTEKYLRALKEAACVVYIDDIASFAYPADILINYNSYVYCMNYKKIYEQAGISLPVFLLGTKFVPLRKEFQDIPARKVKDFAKNIFVSVGGSDPEHIMIKMIKYLVLHHELTKNRQYHFLIGDFEPDQDEILALAAELSWIVPHQKVKEMAKLMLSCDIAVSAAGSTLYELCACGIPTVTYALEDNQIPGANFFYKNQMMEYAGDFRYNSYGIEELFDKVINLCNRKNLRQKMSTNAQNLVDGKGAANVVMAMNTVKSTVSHS